MNPMRKNCIYYYTFVLFLGNSIYDLIILGIRPDVVRYIPTGATQSDPNADVAADNDTIYFS